MLRTWRPDRFGLTASVAARCLGLASRKICRSLAAKGWILLSRAAMEVAGRRGDLSLTLSLSHPHTLLLLAAIATSGLVDGHQLELPAVCQLDHLVGTRGHSVARIGSEAVCPLVVGPLLPAINTTTAHGVVL